MLQKTAIQRTILACTIENRDPMHEVCNVYPTQDTTRMETARVKQEEEAKTRIIVKEYEISKEETWLL